MRFQLILLKTFACICCWFTVTAWSSRQLNRVDWEGKTCFRWCRHIFEMMTETLPVAEYNRLIKGAYDFKEALERQNLRHENVKLLREKVKTSEIVPKFIMDKQVTYNCFLSHEHPNICDMTCFFSFFCSSTLSTMMSVRVRSSWKTSTRLRSLRRSFSQSATLTLRRSKTVWTVRTTWRCPSHPTTATSSSTGCPIPMPKHTTLTQQRKLSSCYAVIF